MQPAAKLGRLGSGGRAVERQADLRQVLLSLDQDQRAVLEHHWRPGFARYMHRLRRSGDRRLDLANLLGVGVHPLESGLAGHRVERLDRQHIRLGTQRPGRFDDDRLRGRRRAWHLDGRSRHGDFGVAGGRLGHGLLFARFGFGQQILVVFHALGADGTLAAIATATTATAAPASAAVAFAFSRGWGGTFDRRFGGSRLAQRLRVGKGRRSQGLRDTRLPRRATAFRARRAPSSRGLVSAGRRFLAAARLALARVARLATAFTAFTAFTTFTAFPAFPASFALALFATTLATASTATIATPIAALLAAAFALGARTACCGRGTG